MRITIADFPDEAAKKETAWGALCAHTEANHTNIVMLPEMPFCDWRMFMERKVNLTEWTEALSVHDDMLARMNELSVDLVVASRPIERDAGRFNQAFFWTPASGYVGGHCKYYLPDEPDGWEATWFNQGDENFAPMSVHGLVDELADSLRLGFQICTEMLFSDVSRQIGQQGTHLIAAPRATSGHRRWLMAASMAAVMSGSFVASTNRRSHNPDLFSGGSWLISPEGEVLVETSREKPFATATVDLAEAERAKHSYPRNIYVR